MASNNSGAIGSDLQFAFRLHQQGQIGQARQIYEDVLRKQPNNIDANFLLGMLNAQQGALETAAKLFEKAARLRPNFVDAEYNCAVALAGLKQFDKALKRLDRVVALKPDHADAWTNRGNILREQKRNEAALDSYQHALEIKPGSEWNWNNQAVILAELQRYDEALDCYQRVLEINPGNAEAYSNRGIALNKLMRFEEALESYERAIALNPDNAEVHSNRGIALDKLRRIDESLESYERAIDLDPDNAEAHSNRAIALDKLKSSDAALESYERATALNPGKAHIFYNFGLCFSGLKRFEEAIKQFEKALAIDPSLDFLYGSYLHAKMNICDWADYDSHLARLSRLIGDSKPVSQPFALTGLTNAPDLQQKISTLCIETMFPGRRRLAPTSNQRQQAKIRIGYFSADFQDHPVVRQMIGVLEQHDRSGFEIFIFSFKPGLEDAMRHRLDAVVEQFIDVSAMSDAEVASLTKSMEIDIAVDLMGFTMNSRLGIFATRAAPVQATFLGYPATTGASFIDYLIADRVVVPTPHFPFYSEKIVHLPGSYCPTSYRVLDAYSRTPAVSPRSAWGLPDAAFVYCCFNNNYKITPEVFASWMRILKEVDTGVLWLFEDNAAAKRNLRLAASANGINSDRLVFAQRAPLATHLARHKLADLFLDTEPYNAHTTACDALWMGLPLLTRMGETFPARVAASVLITAGLPELVTTTRQQYEALAIELANSPERLASIRCKLADAREGSALFNTELFTRRLEAGFSAMHQRQLASLAPDHIEING